MDFEFIVNGQLNKLSLEKKGPSYEYMEEDDVVSVDVEIISENVLSLIIGGKSHRVYIARDKDAKYIYINGGQFVVRESSESLDGLQRDEERSLQDELMIKAPMPGKVIKISVSEGDEVRKNQTLAIVEAMKMENEIKSSIVGIVKKVHAKSGELVDSEKVLIELDKK